MVPYVYRAKNLKIVFNVMFTKCLTLNDPKIRGKNKLFEIFPNQNKNFRKETQPCFCCRVKFVYYSLEPFISTGFCQELYKNIKT